MAKIIAVTNQKGGVGKTSTAVNLAAFLVETGKRVLLIDVDPQGNATTSLGIDKNGLKNSSYELLVGACSAEAAITILPAPLPHVMAATTHLSGVEIELASEIGREYRLRENCAAIADQYDVIFLDCPPSLGLLTLNALVMADGVLVPVQCEFLALEGLSQLMKTIEIVRRRLNKNLAMTGIVLTMFDGRSKLSRQVADEVGKFFPNDLFHTVIPRNVKVTESQSFGQPLVVFDKKAKASQAYYNLSQEVAAKIAL